MKAIFLATAVAAVTAATPGSASIITLGGSHARECYVAAEARNASDEALVTCDRAMAEQELSQRDRLATHVNRGILRMVRGDLAGAQWDYDRAMTLDAREPEVWLNMGVLHYTRGDSDGAVKMFAKAIELRTRHPAFAYYGRGLAHEDRGNIKAAYADLVQARTLRPDWSEPRRELSRYAVRGN